ncbi:ATP-dependent DNA ligase [Macroventuria anomochaeta]|uniref:ATP-dependent DNA ligase n=1 Tax=Macroventuria anomochaeta TaxID=301207 RepID=A0ACB6S732_9PLEO|nr:ATP-dependent DNA ligase [Macroventuria anomochaeta]KAF2630096.1 ATP-dependent DNA ligase [Macroventuria anomochaeta]
MYSPSKRRKKDDGSSKPVRKLDFFFAKQTAKAAATTNGAPKKTDEPVAPQVVDPSNLTDEEYARKLQEEWDREARGELQTQGQPPKEEELSSSNELYRDPSPPATTGVNSSNTEEGNPTTKAEAFMPIIESAAPKPKSNTLSLQSTATEEDTITANIPFDQSPLEFDPSKYIPDLQKHWTADGGRATYALLTRCFILVNSTTSRIKIVDTLVNLLRTIIESDPNSLLPAVWLATNSISPPYIDLELGLGGSAISKALKKVCGLDNAGLRTLNNKYGDAGDVAFEAKKRQSFTLRKPKPLTIKSVFDSLVKIATSKGNGSVEVKQRIVERLIQDARGAEESRYIVRTLVQHLRIGAVKTTMLIALSRAFLLSKPPNAEFETRDSKDLAKLKKEDLAEIYSRNEEIVKASFARRPNYNDIIPALLEIGVGDELLIRCGLALHIPLRPMLGSITRDLGEMLTKLQGRDFSCEYKYDGQRAQVHCDEKGKVTIFSRHLEVMTDKYPDLVALVPKIRGEGVSSFILEGEVVAVDRESGELKTFQTLANRARKDVLIGAVTIDVCLFAFDLMYLNSEELLNRPFRERRDMLRSLFVEIPHNFTWVKSLDATSADTETVSSFFKSALELKCEGIMVKVLDNLPNPDLLEELNEDGTPSLPPTPKKKKPTRPKGKIKTTTAEDAHIDEPKKPGRRKALLSTYEPDKRLDSWLKVKKDYSTTSETLDLIPIGAFHGSGRKASWWSPILLAIRNEQTGTLDAVTKCMSGFTDAFYKANRSKYDPDDPENTNVIRDGKPHYVEYNGGAGWPAVWFEPQEVWEVAFADLTLSPTYTAAIGLVNEDRGLSTRFPRFLRVREDKGIEEATEAEELAVLYRKQEARPRKEEKEGGEEDVE